MVVSVVCGVGKEIVVFIPVEITDVDIARLMDSIWASQKLKWLVFYQFLNFIAEVYDIIKCWNKFKKLS